MADWIDNAAAKSEAEREASIKRAAAKAATIEDGHAGECDGCGDYFERVVERNGQGISGQFCGSCRDEYRLG